MRCKISIGVIIAFVMIITASFVFADIGDYICEVDASEAYEVLDENAIEQSESLVDMECQLTVSVLDIVLSEAIIQSHNDFSYYNDDNKEVIVNEGYSVFYLVNKYFETNGYVDYIIQQSNFTGLSGLKRRYECQYLRSMCKVDRHIYLTHCTLKV